MNTALKPGTYKLATDVLNPKPDRRVKHYLHSWRGWVEWPAGMVFCVTQEPGGGLLRIFPQSGYTSTSIRPYEEGFQQLAEALTETVELPSDYLLRLGYNNYALEIIDKLCCIEDVQAALEQIQREEELKENAS